MDELKCQSTMRSEGKAFRVVSNTGKYEGLWKFKQENIYWFTLEFMSVITKMLLIPVRRMVSIFSYDFSTFLSFNFCTFLIVAYEELYSKNVYFLKVPKSPINLLFPLA